MHIAMDLGLNVLNSNRFAKIQPEAKDLILNNVIDEFITNVIRDVNSANPSQRIPGGSILYEDVIAKYNDIRTLIRTATRNVTTSNGITSFPFGDIPTMFKFESAAANITLVGCNKNIQLPVVIPDSTTYYSYKNHPYAKRKYPIGSILNNTFSIVVNPSYTINSVDIIYINNPQKLDATHNCDLPAEVHNIIVDMAIKKASSQSANDNYENLVIESRKPLQ